MIELINKPWDYKFLEKDGRYFLFVMCGSVAIFEINIELNKEERDLYIEGGNDFIDVLAKKIQYSPSEYSNRNLPRSAG